MVDFFLVATALITLHDVDGTTIYVNPKHVVLLHPKPNELIAKGVNCIVGLANGKRVSAVEDCSTVSKLMEDAK